MKISTSLRLITLALFSTLAASAAITPSSSIDLETRHKDDDSSMDHMELMLPMKHQPATPSSSLNQSELVPTPHVAHHMHGVPILDTDLLPEERLYWEQYNTTTFLTAKSGKKSALYTHIITILTTVFFVYPLAMVSKNTGLKLYIPFFTLHLILMAVSLTALSVYGKSAPRDLYPNNAYSKMSIILLFTTLIHAISALIYIGATSLLKYTRISNKNEGLGLMGGIESEEDEESNLGGSSTHGVHNTSSHDSNSVNSSDWENSDRVELNRLMNEKSYAVPQLTGGVKNFFAKLQNHKYTGPVIKKFSLIANWLGVSNNIVFNIFHWGHFFYFLIYIPTGLATVFCLGKGGYVFNLLAHFIKGGVFFAMGMLSLARYSGSFKGFGWAWNSKYIYQNSYKTFLISMEMVESSLILFYGCTNIFMEHLAAPGGEWTAKDLQHASIAFIYIGSGLCGVISEFKLSEWKQEKALEKLKNAVSNETEHIEVDYSAIIKASPGFSPNPFPLFTIFWTGVLMSSHAQASELSTKVHTQWGNLFVYATGFRLMTYILMMFTPVSFKTLTEPSKPITELLCSFSLLCGGLVFMESTDPIMQAFEYRGFTAMFTLNISLGFIALFMAWEMTVLWFRDWLSQRR